MESSIAIIGTGRVAEALAIALYVKAGNVTAVAGRNEAAAERIAAKIGARAGNLLTAPERAEAALIAVSDEAIQSVAEQLQHAPTSFRVALHTSGAAGPAALQALRWRSTSIGVLHPLQTIPDGQAGAEALPGSAFAYAGEDAALGFAQEVIAVLEGKALQVAEAGWTLYHAAAVMASNYQAALLDAALELMDAAGVSRQDAVEAIAPLYREAARNVLEGGPEAALTGPIRRGDIGTVMNHLFALRKISPPIRDLYVAAGLQTVSIAERAGLPASCAAELRQLFTTPDAR